MRQHEADREAEGIAGRPGLPKPVEVVHGCVGNVFIVDLVRALAAAGQLEAHPGWSGRTRKGAVIDRSRTTGPVGAVVSDVAFSKAVQLVRPIEVHSTELDRTVSCRAERVGVRGYGPNRAPGRSSRLRFRVGTCPWIRDMREGTQIGEGQ